VAPPLQRLWPYPYHIRDVKCDNILLNSNCLGQLEARLSDFGLAVVGGLVLKWGKTCVNP